jgi:hypothetical protein
VIRSGYASLLGIYIGLSSIYWLPGIGLELFQKLKLIFLFLVILILVFRLARQYKTLIMPNRLWGFGVFLFLLVLSVPYLFLSTPKESIYYLLTFSSSFVFLWLMSWLVFYGMPYQLVIKVAAVVFFMMVIMHIFISSYWAEYLSPYLDSTGAYVKFISASFSGSRTSWGLSLVMTFPLYYFVSFTKTGKSPYLFLLMFYLVFLYSAFLINSRSAIVGLTLLFLFFIYYHSKKISFLMLAIILILSFVYFDVVVNSLRIKDANSLDTISSGRLEIIKEAWRIFLQNPLLGTGSELAGSGGTWLVEGRHIHLTPLRLMVEFGIFYMLVFYIMILLSFYKQKKSILQQGALSKILVRSTMGVIIGGIWIGMVEPIGIHGAFNSNLLFWLFMGLWVGAERSYYRRHSNFQVKSGAGYE